MTLRQTITDLEDVMTFGKHKGKAVDWITDNEPSYILWLVDNEIIDCDDEIYEIAIVSDMNQSPPEDFFWEPD